MPLFRKQSAAQLPSLAPHDSKARLLSGRDSQGFMAKPCTPHLITRKGYATSVRQQSCQRLCNAQRVQFFELLSCNGGVKGQSPLRSLGGPRGIFSHVREYPPYPQPHTVWGKDAAPSGCSPSAPCAEKERTSLSRSPLFLLIFCCAEAIIPLPASPLRQRQPSPVRRRNTARSARSASRTSRGTGSWSAGQWRSSSALPRGTRPR